MDAESLETKELLLKAANGDASAKASLLDLHRPRLMQIARCRLNSKLLPRVDASDIVQETMIVAARDLEEFARSRPLPFFVWFRKLLFQRLADAHRTHVQRDMRSVDREIRLDFDWDDQSSAILTQCLCDSTTGPFSKVIAADQREYLAQLLLKLSPEHREILYLKYVEGLTLLEASSVIGITEGAAKMRHLRALDALRQLMSDADSNL